LNKFSSQILSAAVISVLVFSELCSAYAQLNPVRISYSAPTGLSTPAWMANDLGLFEKYGLNGSIIYIGGGPLPMSVMLAGDTDFTMVVGPPAVLARLNGANSIILATLVNRLTMSFVSQPSIRQPNDLRGMRVGITRFGAATDYAARLALKTWGLTSKDVEIIQTGGVGEALAALKAGSIQATVFSPPFSTEAVRAGMTELLDFSRSDIQFVNNSLVTTNKLVQQRPDMIRNVMKALIEGIWAFKKDREVGIKVLKKYTRIQDPSTLGETYDFYSRVLLDVPKTTESGLNNILQALSETQPKARAARPDDFFTSRFMNELEKEGFFKRLASRYRNLDR
jgi:NitT/TauT family transport system substrate-binding protein